MPMNYQGVYTPFSNANPYNYGYMQQPQMQNQPMEQSKLPFQQVIFANEQEAMGRIVDPNTSIMFMDTKNSKFYVKSTDSLGNSTFDSYKFEKIDNTSTDSGKEETYMTLKNAENLATKEELNKVIEKLDKLEKTVQISKILATPTQISE